MADDGRNLIEKLVRVNRVTKVVKGGRILSFSALAVVGNGEGRVGMGKGKAREVPLAVSKAMEQAKREMIKIGLREGTIFHEVRGRHGASKVVVQPASAGTGVIAGGPMRAVMEAAGVRDVLAKSIGSTNPHNLLRATLSALGAVRSPAEIAAKRGKPIREIRDRHRATGRRPRKPAESSAEESSSEKTAEQNGG